MRLLVGELHAAMSETRIFSLHIQITGQSVLIQIYVGDEVTRLLMIKGKFREFETDSVWN